MNRSRAAGLLPSRDTKDFKDFKDNRDNKIPRSLPPCLLLRSLSSLLSLVSFFLVLCRAGSQTAQGPEILLEVFEAVVDRASAAGEQMLEMEAVHAGVIFSFSLVEHERDLLPQLGFGHASRV